MLLHHFTASHLVRKIKQQGLIKGVTPISIHGQLAFFHDQQWLTTNSDVPAQRWNRLSKMVPYDRTACRIALRIPRNRYDQVFTWAHLRQKINILALKNFEDCGGWEDWRVFIGRIEPAWLLSFDAKRDVD